MRLRMLAGHLAAWGDKYFKSSGGSPSAPALLLLVSLEALLISSAVKALTEKAAWLAM